MAVAVPSCPEGAPQATASLPAFWPGQHSGCAQCQQWGGVAGGYRGYGSERGEGSYGSEKELWSYGSERGVMTVRGSYGVRAERGSYGSERGVMELRQ